MALRRKQSGRYSFITNLGEVAKGDIESLRAETRRLAKAANQRMVRLEQAGKRTSPAYQRARDDLETDFGLPRQRYKESTKNLSREELIQEYRSIRAFMTAKSSTVAGYQKIINERYENFLHLTGSDVSEADYVTAWQMISENEQAQKLSYRSHFAMIETASSRWNALSEDEKQQRSFNDVMQSTIAGWSTRDYIGQLRER